VDARAAPRTGFRRGPVQLSLPDLGEHFGVRDLGRRSHRLARGRLGRRCRVRSVPVLARGQCSPGKAARKRVSACLTPSLLSVLQCDRERNCASAIASTTPHRNTFEIMRLFATYHSAHARFTLRDATAYTMTA